MNYFNYFVLKLLWRAKYLKNHYRYTKKDKIVSHLQIAARPHGGDSQLLGTGVETEGAEAVFIRRLVAHASCSSTLNNRLRLFLSILFKSPRVVETSRYGCVRLCSELAHNKPRNDNVDSHL